MAKFNTSSIGTSLEDSASLSSPLEEKVMFCISRVAPVPFHFLRFHTTTAAAASAKRSKPCN